MTLMPDCGDCALVGSCPYPRIFESRTPPGTERLRLYPQLPTPYLLEPWSKEFDTPEGRFNLGLVLFGKASADLHYAVRALQGAGAAGLTAARFQLGLDKVQVELRAAADNNNVQPSWVDLHQDGAVESRGGHAAPVCPAAVRIRFVMPLRIRRDGRYVGPGELNFRLFFGNLIRRMSLLCHFFGQDIETDFPGLLRASERVETTASEVGWLELSRYSTKQRTSMRLGGIVGFMDVDGRELAPFWPALWFGQWTHAGKACSMGLGRYRLESVDGSRWPTPALL